MARKTIRVSDLDGSELQDGRGGTMRLTFADARRGVVEWDVTGEEEILQPLLDKGRRGQRRGRKPATS